MKHTRPCPTCGAEVGKPCRQSNGKSKAPCPERDPQATLDKRRTAAWKQSQKKEAAERAAIADTVPLFAEEALAEVKPATEHYEHWRQVKARSAEGSTGYGMSADMLFAKWQLGLIRRLAREVMEPHVFELLDAKHWGDAMVMWKTALTGIGTAIVLRYDHVEYQGPMPIIPAGFRHGAWHDAFEVPRSRKVWPAEHWPPAGPGWRPPYTREALTALLEIPPPADFTGAVDPMHLQPQTQEV